MTKPDAKLQAINMLSKCDNFATTPKNSLTTYSNPLSLPCMNITRFSLAAALASSVLLTGANGQTTATTDPVGFVTVGIAAGLGTAKKNTLFSVPLMETEEITGQVAGTITGVTASTISNSNAGWTAGALSQPATPFLIQITSGAAEGRLFLISSSANTGGAIAGTANTGTTVTVSSIDTTQVNLTTLGIVSGTDTYKIFACDTLSSFFGTPATSNVQGGTAAASADTIVAVSNGVPSTYFYNTTSVKWVKVAFGSPDASNVALLPYYGVQYSRLANTALSFVVTGQVPTQQREVAVKNFGTTVVSQFWPTDTTLGTSGLSSVVTAGATATLADTVLLTANGVVSTYFYNGTNWKKVAFGTPTADTTVLAIGTSMQIVRKGSASGYTTLSQAVPYNLQ
ncbi:MAG: hypothetical protein JHC85_07250 [Chthoniobacterales bacterium]|nr:hypothetical protein [Chthoniobacterales bacterium]